MKKDLKKIVMIGPVYPYKGGIAHYTGPVSYTHLDVYKRQVSHRSDTARFLF